MIRRSALTLSPFAVVAFVAGCASLGALHRGGAARSERAALVASIDSLADAPEFHNAFWGILVVDPERGDTLYSRNAGKLFLPASNMKVVTSSVALEQLGPDYSYRTALVARGPIRDGTLAGSLAVIGRGDPTISDHMWTDAMIPLRAMADSLAAHGVHRVAGKLVAAGNAFPGAVLGYGWSWEDLESSYSAGVDELLFNEGFSDVRVFGGAHPGDSVRVETKPARTFPVLRTQITTIAAPTCAAGVVSREADRHHRNRAPAVDDGEHHVQTYPRTDRWLGAVEESDRRCDRSCASGRRARHGVCVSAAISVLAVFRSGGRAAGRVPGPQRARGARSSA